MGLRRACALALCVVFAACGGEQSAPPSGIAGGAEAQLGTRQSALNTNFVDEFDRRGALGPNWDVDHGAFYASDGAAFALKDHSTAVWVGTPLADDAVSVTVTAPIHGSVGVLARANAKDPQHDHYAAFVAKDGTVQLERTVKDKTHVLAKGPAFPSGKHQLTLRPTGMAKVTLSVRVDGVEVLQFEDATRDRIDDVGAAGIFTDEHYTGAIDRFEVATVVDAADAGSPVVVDAGTPIVDAGTATVIDAGTPVTIDAGTPVVADAGTPVVVDAGTTVVADAGTPIVVDAGTPVVVDAGAPAVVDAGTPVVDAGTPVVDAGTPVVDAGTPVVDAGTPVVDAGTPGVVDAGTPVVVDAGTPVVIDAGTPVVVDAGTPVSLDGGDLATVFSDSFNGTGALDPAWLTARGSFVQDGGYASSSERLSYSVWGGDAHADDFVSATLLPPLAYTYVGVITRGDLTAPDRQHYAAYIDPSWQVVLARVTDWTFVPLATGPSLDSAAHRITLRAAGSGPVVLTVYVDGDPVISFVDTDPASITSAGRVGMFDYEGQAQRIDDFSVERIGPPPKTGLGPWTGNDAVAPSQLPPFGIRVADAPQFVNIGFDDNPYSGLDSYAGGVEWVVKLFASLRNPAGSGNARTYDGQPARATFLMMGQPLAEWRTEAPALVRHAINDAWTAGNEVANHTQTHSHGGAFTVAQWQNEIQTATSWITKPYNPAQPTYPVELTSGAGVPASQLFGFRTPFLEYNDATLTALQADGFWYDASIEEGFESNVDGRNHFWPYTLDAASPGHDVQVSWGNKTPITSHPGLWEMPVYTVIVPPDSECAKYGIAPGLRAKLKAAVPYFNDASGKITGMDYNLWFTFKMTAPEFVATLKYTLDLRLQGNRAPMLFGAHSDIYSDRYQDPANATPAERRAALQEFINYANSRPEVRLASIKQVLDWMRNPSPMN